MISNITAFNTDEWNTWKAAFRECAKLFNTLKEVRMKKTKNDLKLGEPDTIDLGEYAMAGATLGMEFGPAGLMS